MTNREDKIQQSTADSLQGPSVETLRATTRHENGDLTIESNAGRIRLVNGSDGWKRYTTYLQESNIELSVDEG